MFKSIVSLEQEVRGLQFTEVASSHVPPSWRVRTSRSQASAVPSLKLVPALAPVPEARRSGKSVSMPQTIDPRAACPYPAGSRGKIRWLRARAALGLSLWHPDDSLVITSQRHGWHLKNRRTSERVLQQAARAQELRRQGRKRREIAEELGVSHSWVDVLLTIEG
jgi:hypothetical protein